MECRREKTGLHCSSGEVSGRGVTRNKKYQWSVKMTKRDLVVKIAAETNLIQADVAEVVQKTLDYIADELVAGRDIELRNFGVFEIKIRKGRVGRNPNKPAVAIAIPERAVVKFRAGKELKARIAKLAKAKK